MLGEFHAAHLRLVPPALVREEDVLKEEDVKEQKGLIYQVAVRFDKPDYARLIAAAKEDDRHVADFCRKLLKWAIPEYEDAGSFKELASREYVKKKAQDKVRRTG